MKKYVIKQHWQTYLAVKMEGFIVFLIVKLKLTAHFCSSEHLSIYSFFSGYNKMI